MREIPDFEEHLASVKAMFGREFDFAHRMWDAWMHLPKEPFVFASKLDPMAVGVAMTLNVQACRQMRSVILLCEACEAGNALIVARSIYETTVALQWILAPEVKLGFEPVAGKTDAWKVSTKSIDASLSSRKRAAMYLAIGVFNDENRFTRWENHKDHAQLAQAIKPDPAHITASERELGAEWSYILRNQPRTYSGLKLAALAHVLGNNLEMYYETMYHFLSRSAHSSDGIRYSRSVGGQVGAQWLSTPEEVGGALSAACQVFLCCMSVLQNQIGFGETGENVVDQFTAEYLKGF